MPGLPPDIRTPATSEGGALRGRLHSVEARLDAYRLVVDAIDDVVFRLDTAGKWIFLNPAWERLTGISVAGALGRPLLDSIHPEDRHTHALQLRRLISGSVASVRLEVRLQKRDGSICWVQMNGRRTCEDDEFTGVSGTLHDISDRKHVENTLALSELRFKAVFEHAAVGILVALPDGRLLSANPALQHMVGIRDRELRGRHMVSLARSEHTSALEQCVMQLASGEKEECRLAFQCESRRAEQLDVQLHGTLIRDSDQQPLLIVGLLEDLTERKLTEQRLVRAKEEAESVARLKSALLDNVSHEVRTPLTTIIGYAAILAEEVPDDLKEFAHTIASGGQRLLDTLNAVLELARLESSPPPNELSPIDVNQEVIQAVELATPLADRKKLDLRLKLPERSPRVLADGTSLLRVLNHLLANAVKFTETGHVSVSVAADESTVRIDVADTGVGISPGFLPQLFDEFKQESSGLKRSFEGSGLGLAISRKLVHLMGGSLQAESKKGEGSVFTVRLPLHPDSR